MKYLLLLICFFLFSCGGDDNGHQSPPPPPAQCEFTYSEWAECQSDNTQVRTVISQQPEGCEGVPILTQTCTYVPPTPEPNDCCPDPVTTLRCEQCPEEKPCIVQGIYVSTPGDMRVICSTTYAGVAQWILKIDWGSASLVERPDTNCCSIEKTGLTYEKCNRLTKCNLQYLTTPTEWYIFGDADNNWWVYSDRLWQSWRILVNE